MSNTNDTYTLGSKYYISVRPKDGSVYVANRPKIKVTPVRKKDKNEKKSEHPEVFNYLKYFEERDYYKLYFKAPSPVRNNNPRNNNRNHRNREESSFSHESSCRYTCHTTKKNKKVNSFSKTQNRTGSPTIYKNARGSHVKLWH